jgi:dsDNA-specific endonuclease/ATPase MutS2
LAGRFETGQVVRVLSLNQDGEVLADGGDHLLIAVGPMRTTVPKSDVRLIGNAPAKMRAGSEAGAASLGAATTVPTE